jgi:hypothetical protein
VDVWPARAAASTGEVAEAAAVAAELPFEAVVPVDGAATTAGAGCGTISCAAASAAAALASVAVGVEAVVVEASCDVVLLAVLAVPDDVVVVLLDVDPSVEAGAVEGVLDEVPLLLVAFGFALAWLDPERVRSAAALPGPADDALPEFCCCCGGAEACAGAGSWVLEACELSAAVLMLLSTSDEKSGAACEEADPLSEVLDHAGEYELVTLLSDVTLNTVGLAGDLQPILSKDRANASRLEILK